MNRDRLECERCGLLARRRVGEASSLMFLEELLNKTIHLSPHFIHYGGRDCVARREMICCVVHIL